MSKTFKKPSTFSNIPIGTEREEWVAVLGRDELINVDVDDVADKDSLFVALLLLPAIMFDISIFIFGDGSRFFLPFPLLDDEAAPDDVVAQPSITLPACKPSEEKSEPAGEAEKKAKKKSKTHGEPDTTQACQSVGV